MRVSENQAQSGTIKTDNPARLPGRAHMQACRLYIQMRVGRSPGAGCERNYVDCDETDTIPVALTVYVM